MDAARTSGYLNTYILTQGGPRKVNAVDAGECVRVWLGTPGNVAYGMHLLLIERPMTRPRSHSSEGSGQGLDEARDVCRSVMLASLQVPDRARRRRHPVSSYVVGSEMCIRDSLRLQR